MTDTYEDMHTEKQDTQAKKRKWSKRILITIAVLVVCAGTGFYVWTLDYYHADQSVYTTLQENQTYATDDYIVLESHQPSQKAVIFYPGAKVQPEAYLPMLDKLRDTGVTCILVKMPLNLAVLGKDKATQIMQQFPNVKEWYMAGHSMGGGMASAYASDHQDKIKGLILYGSYVFGDYPTNRSLTVYGTFNTSVKEKITYTDNIVVIDGGNHAQFGNYGKQKGDPDATISADEQQNQAVQATQQFLNAA